MQLRPLKLVFYILGFLALLSGTGLIAVTVIGKLPPLTGYSAGGFVYVAGASLLIAGARNYHGHWSFVTGIVLSTLALTSLGTDIDEYVSGGDRSEAGFALFLVVAFLTFGVLSLWSGHRLHKYTLELEHGRAESGK